MLYILFDWQSDWFEPRNNVWDTICPANITSSTNATTRQCASVALGMLNESATALATDALSGVKAVINGQAPTMSGAQWLRALVGRREWHIPRLDVYIRI